MSVWLVAAAAAALVGLVVFLNLRAGRRAVPARPEVGYALETDQFPRTLGHLLGPPVMPGNRVTTLLNGREIFPAMLGAVRAARESVTLETYIYWSGRIGREFSDALVERVRAGVRVHVLLDWAGSSKMDPELLERMESAGVAVERYHPLRWYTIHRLNRRTHRKILVVDGRTGFTGGVGIADPWLGDAEGPDQWRDTHFQVEGPVVADLQAAFMDNWMRTRGEVLHDARYFPPLSPAGSHAAQVFTSSAREGSDSMRLLYLYVIGAARRSLEMSNSYFVPDPASIEALISARRRGVRVRILVPGARIDATVTRRASRALWGPLLEAGVEIHEFQPTMFHCKVLVADGRFASVGSTNFDNRSFRLNDEANLNVLDADFARRQEEIFARDLERSRRVTLEEWRNRPLREKLVEGAARLLRSQL